MKTSRFFERYIPEGDTIRAVFHRHFFAILPNLIFWMVVPIGLVMYAIYSWGMPYIRGTPVEGIVSMYAFAMYAIMLYKILDWYADVWLITDRGIVDVRWSLFTKDTSFIEFHDIIGIQAQQSTLHDKLWNIGDITLLKVGSELRVARMYEPEVIVKFVQAQLQLHHHPEKKPEPGMHIYLDGVKELVGTPFKDGFRFAPNAPSGEDTKFVDELRKQPGTIDLSNK